MLHGQRDSPCRPYIMVLLGWPAVVLMLSGAQETHMSVRSASENASHLHAETLMSLRAACLRAAGCSGMLLGCSWVTGTNLLRGRASGNSRIRTLNLSGNNIGDKGAALLAEMLKARTYNMRDAACGTWRQQLCCGATSPQLTHQNMCICEYTHARSQPGKHR